MGVIAQTKKASSGSSTKYVYAMFTISKPVLSHTDAMTIGDKYYPETNNVKWKDVVFVSEIKEITGFNEDKKYKFLDDATDGFQQTPKYSLLNQEFELAVFKQIPYKEQSSYDVYKPKIKQNDCLVFKTYKEASLSRSNVIYGNK